MLSKNTWALAAGIILSVSCSSEKTDSESQNAVSWDRSASLTDEAVDDLVEEGEIPETMGACLAAYEASEDFTVGDALDFQTRNAFEGDVLNKVKFKDEKITEEQRFILYSINARMINSVDIRLENPNGIYCIDISAEMINSIKVKADCNAEVLETSIASDFLNKFKFSVFNEDECEGEEEDGPEKEEEVEESEEAPEDAAPEEEQPEEEAEAAQ